MGLPGGSSGPAQRLGQGDSRPTPSETSISSSRGRRAAKGSCQPATTTVPAASAGWRQIRPARRGSASRCPETPAVAPSRSVPPRPCRRRRRHTRHPVASCGGRIAGRRNCCAAPNAADDGPRPRWKTIGHSDGSAATRTTRRWNCSKSSPTSPRIVGNSSTYWWPLRCVGCRPWSRTNCTCGRVPRQHGGAAAAAMEGDTLKERKNAGKLPPAVQQLRRIAAGRQGAAGGQVQVNAQVEGAVVVAELAPQGSGRQPAGAVLGQQCFPQFQGAAGVGGIGQQ